MSEWLDRALVVSPYHYCLCIDEKSFRKELKKLDLPKDQWPSFLASAQADATVHFFEHSNGNLCAIVCIRASKKHSKEQVYAMLVHEAVHIWQEILDYLGEKSPSKEFEAYSVQTFCQRLFESYAAQTKGKK